MENVFVASVDMATTQNIPSWNLPDNPLPALITDRPQLFSQLCVSNSFVIQLKSHVANQDAQVSDIILADEMHQVANQMKTLKIYKYEEVVNVQIRRIQL